MRGELGSFTAALCPKWQSKYSVSFVNKSDFKLSCFKARLGGGSPLRSSVGGATPAAPTASVRPSVSRSVLKLTGASLSSPPSTSLPFWDYPFGRHFHPRTALPWLMETDIREHVRECVRSFEKVRNAANDAPRSSWCC